MLSVCDGATMALDDHEKPVIPINRVIVSLIEKTRLRIYWYTDVTSCSRVDYTVAFAIWVRCCATVELGGITNVSEDLLLCAGMS
jgi:hypothetical protein